jgi:hypothetical protein
MKMMIDRSSVVQALNISARQMANMLPIFTGIILCIGLLMISYFGWLYVLILTFLTITGSVVAGYVFRILVKK